MSSTPPNRTALGRSWKKSSYSTEGNCVEARLTRRSTVEMRDSKNVDLPPIRVPVTAWRDFLDSVRSGRFDR